MIVINFEFGEDGTCTHVRGDTAQFEMEVQVDGAVIPSVLEPRPDALVLLVIFETNQSVPSATGSRQSNGFAHRIADCLFVFSHITSTFLLCSVHSSTLLNPMD